uniref:Peptidase S1 domain-containing protein n=1 Tax=Ciona intestinalis TaxID=7719 RepID=F6V6U3_CIOIN
MAGIIRFLFFVFLFAALELQVDSTLEQKDVVSHCENVKDCDLCVYDYEIEFVQGCAVCKCTSPIAREQRMATWKRWERWSECDRSCNFGTRTRVRRCRNGVVGGIGCIGPVFQNRRCRNKRCPLWFDANKGSLPWMVTLRRYPSFSFFCGGSIIDKNWILTAAHCVENKPESYRGILGNYFNKMVDEEETIVGFSSVHIHKSYNDNTLDNDIALLKVAEPIVFNDHVKPVCLPEYNAGVSYVPNTDVIISGWGTLKSNGALSNALQQAYVDIVSLEECGKRYSSVFAPSVMCAGILDKGGIDTCQGDSGGPLVDPNGNVQLGVVSWGRGCALAQYPGVYTLVSYYRRWLDNIRNNN